MARARFGLLVAAVLSAMPAFAQPSPAPPDVPAAAPAASPPEPRAPTVESLTVRGRRLPTKTCSSRDKDCIARVVAELQQQYPRELKKFCLQWQIRAVRTQWLNAQLNAGLGNDEPSPVGFGVNSAVKQACAEPKPAKK
jgi:hypothetical protein